jgi:hypothetical protein
MKEITLPKIFQPFLCNDLIRLGRQHDGGYLVNELDVSKTTRLISLGIGDDLSFEQDFLSRNPCPISAYDGTIDRKFENISYHKINIGSKEGETRFSSLLQSVDRNVFLKCDIEGSEYGILNDIIVNDEKFSGIVIEFHDVHQYPLFNELSSFIAKIKLKLVHVHLNNYSYLEIPGGYLPGCMELTFTSSNNVQLATTTNNIELPHRLDSPNAPERSDFRITF